MGSLVTNTSSLHHFGKEWAMELSRLFELEPHGPDTFVGIGPRYPWGGLFGGQIVAQALRAAAATVDADQQVHSLRAYFIRRGDHTEPIRFEVDRIRNGRSFSTRRVVARQAIGAILNLEASFQAPEATADVQPVPMDLGVPGPDELTSDAWSDAFDRRTVPHDRLPDEVRTGTGRSAAWMRVTADLAGHLPADQLLHRCWLAYMSDDMPADTVRGPPRVPRRRRPWHHLHRQPRPHHLVPPAPARRPMAPVRLRLPRVHRRARPGHRACLQH